MAPSFDSELLRRWIDAATRSLTRHRAEIDRINVFPVPDGDTGSNMLLTVQAALRALGPARPGGDTGTDTGGPDTDTGSGDADADADADTGDGDPDTADAGATAAALAGGALRGARGNSGLILTQLLRGVSDELAARAGTDRRAASAAGGALFASALRRAATLARSAVHRPRHGTILTVLEAAAAASTALPEGTPLAETAAVASRAAGDALEATTGQLPELARARVVDAGGMGLVLILDSLAEVLGNARRVLSPGPAQEESEPGQTQEAPVSFTTGRESGSEEYDYEVMYLLDGSDPDRVAVLRDELDGLGDSVAVVGDGLPGGAGTWNVHVHCTDVGAAVEAGIRAGRPSGIRVLRFADQAPAQAPARVTAKASQVAAPVSAPVPAPAEGRHRAVLLMIESAGAAALARSAGADVLRPVPGLSARTVADAVAATGVAHVVVLPCDGDRRAVAEAAVPLVEGTEVVVVPSVSVLQGLSALAVHDPDRRAGDDVVAMAEAAAGTRTGGLMVSETEALTWAGRCQPGDVLGVSDGEVVLIAPDLAVGALWLAHRMLTPGGELVTALLGAAAPDSLGVSLAEDLWRTHPEVDVVVHRGEQQDFPLVLGVE
ncbi:DAK2 domain-containing protein [Pseudonocardia sp. KRD291]|uniref:DAK2 domain-containing protein n=1 Tax=Pseudonocardia sp. KRD291 TaxID=2792007 RepID=UPI0027E3588F|nr:DAK2 domain-containing protein [Pseudonocardia sp. KRD291]